MNNFFIYLAVTFFFSQQLAQSQNLKDKNVLIVWGGWEGHNPKLFSNIIESWLNDNSANITIKNSLDIYSNYNDLIKFDLIIQSVTQSSITPQQEKNLLKAVQNGVGFAGAHGGIIDSFRSNTNYQFMTGGQWVEHPGGMVNFKVEIIENEFTRGIDDFEVFSEQYYLHYDPNVEILATTTFNGTNYPWINNVKMPIAWKKQFGEGKVFFISIGHDPNEFKIYKNGWELLKRGLVWAGSK
jgi:hypothetical protein